MKNGVILFVKYPEPGKVKTRIAAVLGNEYTSELYKNFVADILKKLAFIEADILVYFTPEEKRRELSELLGGFLPVYPQKGSDVGERMKNAFREQFQAGYSKLILIGSDIPHIPVDYLKKALEMLEDEYTVIGPAVDGGYYLIGFHKDNFTGAVFDGLKWSTDTVYEETLRILEKQQQQPSVLLFLRDIDTADDLKIVINDYKEEMPETTIFWNNKKGRNYGP